MRTVITPESHFTDETHQRLADRVMQFAGLHKEDVARIVVNDSVAVSTVYLRDENGSFYLAGPNE